MQVSKLLQILFCLILIATPGNAAQPDGQDPPLPAPVSVPGGADKEVINPHWTGKDCDVCHEERPEPGEKDLRLKFGGDDVAMCNSCHTTAFARADLHPVNITPREGDRIQIPDELPLRGNKITCLTCHDILAHIQKSPPEQFTNPDFLRGGPYARKTEICFRCHRVAEYTKINPHEQVAQDGSVLTSRCLFCHQTLPDPERAKNLEDVTFKTEIGTFCTACHPKEETNHPARVVHTLKPEQQMLSHIEEAEQRFNVSLPLFEGQIFCGTCHNPHAQGIIERQEAAKGSEEKRRLRLSGSYDLCIACHADKAPLLTKEIDLEIPKGGLDIPVKNRETPVYHEAFVEKKCKACHVITREEPERPSVYRLCFQSACHTDTFTRNRYVHTVVRQGKCLVCHNQHGTRFGYHIVNDQQRLCKACHPLLRTKTAAPEQRGADEKDLHEVYMALRQTLVPNREPTCISCHGVEHQDELRDLGIQTCYQCHNYMKRLIRDLPGKPRNVHDTYTEDTCSACHDPHGSSHLHQLKEPPEYYLQEAEQPFKPRETSDTMTPSAELRAKR